MTFQIFIEDIVDSFNNFLDLLRDIIPSILDDNFVKLIIYIGLFSIVIFIICFVITLIYSLFENEKTRLFWENLSYENYDRQYRRNSIRRERKNHE